MAKDRIRQLNKRGSRSEKSPTGGATRRTPPPTACHECGAFFARKTWRRDHKVTAGLYDRVVWRLCPACRQCARGEGQGLLVVQGAWAARHGDEIRRRLANVAERAAATQPERRVVSTARRGQALEVLTTSQKLAHRMARELAKAFGGRATYRWSDDGSLRAAWTVAARDARGARS